VSLLLDALRKADRERRSDQPPSPFEAPAPAAPPVSAARTRAPSGLATGLWGLVIALLVLALVIWQRTPAPAEVIITSASTPTPQPTPTARPVPTQEVLQRPPPPRRTSPPTPVEALFTLDELAMPPVAPINPAATPLVAADVPAAASAEPGANLPPAAPDLPEDTISRTDLPAVQRERIPAYRLDVHAYHSDPGRRFVLIDGQRHTEGSMLEGGFILNEIVPQGIVIEADGQRVLIQRPG
jgi:general secretion pathway protein B